MSADIRVIYESNFRDPAATLRVIADEIDAGKYGDVGQFALVLLGDTCEVFTGGHESGPCDAAALLQAGAFRLVQSIAERGR